MIDRRKFIGFGTFAAGAWASGALADGAKAKSPERVPGATATTTAGKVRGTREGKIQAFRGIPYGASTAGANRFMPPKPPEPWTGVRDAFELGHRAPQLVSSFVGFVPPEVEVMDRMEPMGEDCLVLNVWTRDGLASRRRLHERLGWFHLL